MKQQQQQQQQQQHDFNNKIFVKLPFISDSCSTRIQHSFKVVNKKVHIAWINQKPLWRILKPATTLTCGIQCICNNRGLCLKKNIVYLIHCNHCPSTYVGETHRTVFSRVSEHLKTNTSNVFRHLCEKHLCMSPTISDISFSIVGCGFTDSTHRKKFESDMISRLRSDLNIQS